MPLQGYSNGFLRTGIQSTDGLEDIVFHRRDFCRADDRRRSQSGKFQVLDICIACLPGIRMNNILPRYIDSLPETEER